MERSELASLCFLHRISGVGNKTLWKIQRIWGSFKACCEADRTVLQSHLSASIVEAIIAGRNGPEPAQELDRLLSRGINICTVDDEAYPGLLASIYDPPYLFYYQGNLGITSQDCLAVVGARAATNYGKIQARRLSREMAARGWTIISGLARGIDTEAHYGALEAGGKTAAVLGSGIEVIYPPENRRLYEQICQNGLVVSEFPPAARPDPGHFPQRNRTIAGLCRGIVVVEAKQRSGALITADFGLEQGRDIFAVPGPINSPNSEGTNNLIKQGACLVGGFEDILTEYGENPEMPIVRLEPGNGGLHLNKREAEFLDILGYEPVHVDVLHRTAGLGPGELSTLLLKMELSGLIRALPGSYYMKA